MELTLLLALSHGPTTHGEYASPLRRAPNHIHPHSPIVPPEISAHGPFYLHLHSRRIDVPGGHISEQQTTGQLCQVSGASGERLWVQRNS